MSFMTVCKPVERSSDVIKMLDLISNGSAPVSHHMALDSCCERGSRLPVSLEEGAVMRIAIEWHHLRLNLAGATIHSGYRV